MQQVHKTQAFTTSSSGWSSWRGVKRPLKRYATASTETFTQPIGLSQRNSGAICSCCSASASNVHSTPDESGSYLEADTLHGNQPHNSGGGNQQATAVSPSLTQRVKNFFGGGKFDRKRLQALGMGAVASYGFVSNATYGTGLAISWIAFVRQTGVGCPACWPCVASLPHTLLCLISYALQVSPLSWLSNGSPFWPYTAASGLRSI